MRVVGYVRVSTEEQAQDGVSLEAQRSKVAQYAHLYELDLVEVVSDAGFSAKSFDRPGIRKVLDMLESGAVGGVVIAKLDRLTRNLGDWSYLIENFFMEKKGKSLFSVNDSVNTTTANGRLMLNIIMTIAQWEREIIAERTRDSLQHKIRNGERCGKVLYGYDVDPDSPLNGRGNPGRLIPNAAEQETIALMKSLRGEGRTLRAIAATLRELGIHTKEGKELWTPATINKILKRVIHEKAGEGEAA